MGTTMIIGRGHYLTSPASCSPRSHFRHLPEPENVHRHPDVDRADPSAVNGNLFVCLLVFSSRPWSARCSRFWSSTVAARSAIGSPILLVAYNRKFCGSNRGRDTNLMKG